jgi:NAD(P)-dependent dehydrogenase (short-subunit alcohol dehydrogenase family)
MPITMAYSTTKGALVTDDPQQCECPSIAPVSVSTLSTWDGRTPQASARCESGKGQAADWQKRVQADLPFGRLLDPEEIATLVVYLLSDAATMMTGSIIDFDQNVLGTYGPETQPIF